MGDNPTAHLFSELLRALHDESDALVANDAVRLADASTRREHVLRLLAPQANALRTMRRTGADEYDRFVLEAAQLAALDNGHTVMRLAEAGTLSGRLAALRAAESD